MLEQRIREVVHYDPDTGIMTWLEPSKFHVEKVGTPAGTVTPGRSDKAYWNVSINGRKYKRSRLAFLYMTGRWPAHTIDHINGNSLDDRWANLREATVTENAWNHRKRAKASSLPMGVRAAASGRFQARLMVNKQMHYLGCFDTPEAAAAAYQKAREAHYGQFA